MKLRFWLLMICGLALPSQAQEPYSYNFYTYAKWQRLPAEMRMTYVGGALDVLTGVANTDEEKKVGGHYAKCLNESGFRLRQLTDNIDAYAAAHPNIQRNTMPGVVIDYLIELCGAPTQ